jgi:hypothetical protein
MVGVCWTPTLRPSSLSELTSAASFPWGINHKRQVGFVIRGKSLCEALQVVRSDLRLVLKNIIAKLVAEVFRLSIEVARDHRRIERPVVHG